MTQLEQTISQIFASRRLTREDQQRLMNLFSRRGLSDHDTQLISSVYEALSQGRVRVVE